jgi:glycosyltransferase involved in cell wall biosynthesis
VADLRIVQLNLAYDKSLDTPDALLETYHTLTGWSRAVSGAGASVHVVQRYSREARFDQETVAYEFVAEGTSGTPAPWTRFERVLSVVERAEPDVVHVNGLIFPGMTAALRHRLPAGVAIVLQDHSGRIPRRWMTLRSWKLTSWREAFATVDAVTFTARELAEPWYRLGLSEQATILEIPEASTEMSPVETSARGDHDSCSILWVGRLNRNKDPMTALDALEMALPKIARARCTMVFQNGELEAAVRDRIRLSSVFDGRVTPVGKVAYDALPSHYSAADVFLSASHHEGSGYALIESMACGVTPCVTDIPAFRALTGECGRRWPVGNASAAATALVDLAASDRWQARKAVRARFERVLSWDVVGTQTVYAYQAVSTQKLEGISR